MSDQIPEPNVDPDIMAGGKTPIPPPSTRGHDWYWCPCDESACQEMHCTGCFKVLNLGDDEGGHECPWDRHESNDLLDAKYGTEELS